MNVTYTIGSSIGLTLSPVVELLNIRWDPTMEITLHGSENNQTVKLVLAPEGNMTPKESLLLNVLFSSLMSGAGEPSHEQLMSFVRQHNLERHFKMSV